MHIGDGINLEPGEFHSSDGLVFARQADGSVRVRLRNRMVTVLHPSAWASVVAHVSERGGVVELGAPSVLGDPNSEKQRDECGGHSQPSPGVRTRCASQERHRVPWLCASASQSQLSRQSLAKPESL